MGRDAIKWLVFNMSFTFYEGAYGTYCTAAIPAIVALQLK